MSLSFHCEAAVAARFDRERMSVVFANLLCNAVEAAESGGEVEVVLSQVADWAEIEVADNGPGPPEGMDIFQPFATTKDRGTGLGLAIAQRIVCEHGGSISVERTGGMTRFLVVLPLDPAL